MKNKSRKASRKAQHNFIMRFPNSIAGRLALRLVKRYLNKDSYSLDCKATGSREAGKINTKMSDAKSIRVYLQAKTPDGLKQVDRKGVQI
tara:strand:+ start:1406 stop:1675 length:270 start_codon:yes stop_codon:yes gene_type:complete